MLSRFLVFLFACLLFSFPAQAENLQTDVSCYNADDYAAEQMMRFQSQMMVIGMVCRDYSSSMGGSYELYQNFSQAHQRLIRRYEQRLINLFKQEGSDNAVNDLHELRTQIANSLSRYAMKISPPKFCQALLPRLEKIITVSEDGIEKMVSTVSNSQESTRPLCFAQKNAKKKK